MMVHQTRKTTEEIQCDHHPLRHNQEPTRKASAILPMVFCRCRYVLYFSLPNDFSSTCVNMWKRVHKAAKIVQSVNGLNLNSNEYSLDGFFLFILGRTWAKMSYFFKTSCNIFNLIEHEARQDPCARLDPPLCMSSQIEE